MTFEYFIEKKFGLLTRVWVFIFIVPRHTLSTKTLQKCCHVGTFGTFYLKTLASSVKAREAKLSLFPNEIVEFSCPFDWWGIVWTVPYVHIGKILHIYKDSDMFSGRIIRSRLDDHFIHMDSNGCLVFLCFFMKTCLWIRTLWKWGIHSNIYCFVSWSIACNVILMLSTRAMLCVLFKLKQVVHIPTPYVLIGVCYWYAKSVLRKINKN